MGPMVNFFPNWQSNSKSLFHLLNQALTSKLRQGTKEKIMSQGVATTNLFSSHKKEANLQTYIIPEVRTF